MGSTISIDADGERVVKTLGGGASTAYFQGVFEQTGSAWKHSYAFNGQVVAVRDQAGVVTYLHGDHLGSASVATNQAQGEGDIWLPRGFD